MNNEKNPATSHQTVNPQTPEVGQLVKDKGIYIGLWEPTDKKGNSLGRIFDLYAAPKDIKKHDDYNLYMTFNEAVHRVSELKDWHGHNGGNFENEQTVLEAVQNNPEKLSDWFIPTKGIWLGENEAGKKIKNTQAANLYSNEKKMLDANKFEHNFGEELSEWYWSCTEHKKKASNVYSIVPSFSLFKVSEWENKDDKKMSVRPVRAELRP